jgi:hypothetical protein
LYVTQGDKKLALGVIVIEKEIKPREGSFYYDCNYSVEVCGTHCALVSGHVDLCCAL